ncbi:type II CRISPR RNA-guided endonuclease Cas9 [Spiroplasma tabanidicola]|uniref:CRISPR-associated endonuclease Cas9 n=1 Tax=Spiroplasma tabanidicola TaxID=324079 RepID=A0A6I6CAM2_9MOLU|nr:type II CRISPR RNA-guided endonuclease Cas9 [Spiroplasma tabanidicola]QGS51965.1 CRISPR-associated protein Cas9 [Spiroplasma tabanidicola]
MKKVNVGLDIGIASVGWSIYDIENKKIINAGSRLFSEANAGGQKTSTTSDRRMQRTRRRNLRRKVLRKRDLLNIFVKFDFLNSYEDFYKLDFNIDYLEVRKKSLENKISLQELMLILYNYTKKRGSFNYKDDLMELKKEKKEDVSLDEINAKQDKLPVDIQANNFKTFGKYRGLKAEDALIAHDWYKKEVEKILDTQIANGLINEEFKESFIKLYERKRQYFDGPGWTTSSKTTKSEYGWKDESEFFERLSGYDTYNSKEKRAPKHSMTSYLFNILNDLCNLKINDVENGLTYDQKYEVIESVINHDGTKSKNITLKIIAKLLKVKESDITGYRIDKKEKPNFTKFESINKIRSILISSNLKYDFISLKNIDLLDKIVEILTVFQSSDSRKEQLLKINSNLLDDKQIEAISLISLTGTHSLSAKTMNIAIEEMWYENKNHMQIFSEKNIKPDYNIKIDRKFTKMPVLRQKISEMYISPVVKRSLIESLKIIKEIENMSDIEIKDIVIELARESNSEDRKKYINEIQKKNEKERTEIEKKYNQNTKRIDFKTRLKLTLLNEQDGKCVYSGKTIDITRLFNDPNYCEIDHIIPFSVSLDDSRTNKVLVLQNENQQKGKKTPYEYFREIHRDWEQFKSLMYINYVGSKKFGKYGYNKYQNLIFEQDINDTEVKKSFINRNLNDTRYATLEVKNYLTFFKKELKKPYSIKTINGGFTNYIRSNFLYLPKKDRDDFKHHAVDATICALAPIIDIYDGRTMNKIIGELDEKEIIKREEINLIVNDINSFDYKFTKKIEKSSNKMMFNETIYSCKVIDNNLYKIEKIDLLSKDSEKIKKINKLFTIDYKDLLVYESDSKTFNHLKKIYDTYINDVDKDNKPVKNPFHHFVYELNEKIIKQSNEKNPPNIRYLKYNNGVVNQYTKITHKFKNVKKGKEIVMTGSNTLGWDLFYSQQYNLYKVLPITHKVAYFVSNKNNSNINFKTKEYEQEKLLYKIDETYKKKFTLFKNNELIFEYDGEILNYIVVGFDKNAERFEFKYLNKSVENEKRIFKSIKKMKKIKLVTSNSTRTKIKYLD